MSVTPVLMGGSGSTASGSTFVLSLTTGCAVGDDLFAVFANASTITLSSVTDTGGNIWTIDASSNTSGCPVAIAHTTATAALVAGTDTITGHYSASTARRMGSVAKIVSGGLSASPLDQTVSNATGATTAVSVGPTAALAQADEFAVLAVSLNEAAAGETVSFGGGFSVLDSEVAQSGSNNHITYLAWLETASTSALTATGTVSAAPTRWNGALATYKVASGGGGGGSSLRLLGLLGVGT